jgi:TolC family type I secretion outer membrane protein
VNKTMFNFVPYVRGSYRVKGIFSLVVCLVCFLPISGVLAQSLSFDDQVAEILKNHPRIEAAKQTIKSLQEGLRISQKSWFPALTVTGNKAKEDRNNVSGTGDTIMRSNELKLTLTQPVYHFGSKSAATVIARLQLEQSEKTLELTRQSLILEIGVAQMGVATAIEKLRYSKRSLSNLQKQTKLENIRVKSGAGVSTDVLQAKVQLAGAKARLLAAEGQLNTQENRYLAVFGQLQNEFLKSRKLRLPVEGLPETIAQALEIARKNNSQLQTLKDAVSLAKASLSQVKADQIWPKIDFTIDKSFKENVGGTRGKAQEYVAKLQFTYNFNLGFSAVNNIDAARANYVASQKQFDDARRLIDEAVRNSFTAYKQALENAVLLKEQAKLSKAFLELARKERKLGKRSLLEILSGETAEINSRSDAAEADGARVSTALALLSAMGVLEPKHLVLQ